MKRKFGCLLNNMIPVFFVLLTSIISNVFDFNYMNYTFFLPRYPFIIISLILIIYFSSIRRYLYDNRDNIYYFKTHILLIIVWIFLFFFYKEFYISFISILFNLVILTIVLNRLIHTTKFKFMYIVYYIWFIYLIIINLLIM